MTSHPLLTKCVVLTAFVLMAVTGSTTLGSPAAVQDGYAKARQEFRLSVNDYLDLRVRAALWLPIPDETRASRLQMIQAHAAAVQIARETARRGEIFTPAVSTMFRESVAAALREQGLTAAALVRPFRDRYKMIEPPIVNERFAWLRIAPMPEWLTDALPVLPLELRYRLFDRELVLFDYDLSLVVDILPDALSVPPVRPRSN
jgi:hypothetical protein